jgi:hypothetical protein
VAWTYDITPAPAVGDKITAAGFGAQTDGAVAELQSAVDTITGGSAVAGATSYASTYTTNSTALLLHEWAKPGYLVQGLTGAVTSVAAGPTTVVSGPSSGRRIVKNIAINALTLNTTVTATLASTTLFTINFAAAGFFQIPCAVPIANGETLQITTDHTVTVTASYADRTGTALDRLGFVKSTGSGTLRASGTAATISQLWLCNTDNSAGNIALTIGSAVIDVSMPARSILTIDDPIAIPAATAVTYVSGGTNVAMLAVGY